MFTGKKLGVTVIMYLLIIFYFYFVIHNCRLRTNMLRNQECLTLEIVPRTALCLFGKIIKIIVLILASA